MSKCSFGRKTRYSDIGLELLHRRCCWPGVAFWEVHPAYLKRAWNWRTAGLLLFPQYGER